MQKLERWTSLKGSERYFLLQGNKNIIDEGNTSFFEKFYSAFFGRQDMRMGDGTGQSYFKRNKGEGERKRGINNGNLEWWRTDVGT